MRKWRCISVNEENRDNFTVGKIYETDDKMLNCRIDDGYMLKNIPIVGKGDAETGLVFEEVKEEERKVNKFKVGDKVRIIARESGHCFKIGDMVELYEKSPDGDFRGRQEGNSRDLGNWIRQEEMELIKENKSTSKTLTITTSDSTTILTDGTHITTINRYYTDKHDEKVAVNEVVKKYYDELAEIDRVNKTPKVGDKVKVVDEGRTFSSYATWLIDNKISLESAIKWENNSSPRNGETYTIKEIHPHGVFEKDVLALIEDCRRAFIINLEGLEVVK